jgi:hypothetical protein
MNCVCCSVPFADCERPRPVPARYEAQTSADHGGRHASNGAYAEEFAVDVAASWWQPPARSTEGGRVR